MSDEAKLGLIAGVLAVIAVAIFGFPKELSQKASPSPAEGVVAGTATTPPGLPPAAVQVARPRE